MSQVPSSAEILNAFEEYLIAVCGFSPRTVDSYSRYTKLLLWEIQEEYVSVSEADLRGYVRLIQKEKNHSAKTANLIVSAWQKFFTFLKKRNYRTDNPAAILERPKTKKSLPKWVPQEEMNKLLEGCDGALAEDLRLRAVVYLLYASGMRISELTHLRMADWVSREQGLLRVTGKGGKTRLVPLGKQAEDALNVYIENARNVFNAKGSDFIFPSPKQKEKPLTRQRMFQLIQELGTRVGVEISAHKFRHSCATHMLEKGADLASIQTLLGHSMLQTTEIYTDVLDETLRKAVEENHPLTKKD